MFMKKSIAKRTPEEREGILRGIQKMGLTAGLRFYNIGKTTYYEWLEKYNRSGLDGLRDGRSQTNEAELKKLKKENLALKELLAEERLASKMKDELLKKKFAQQKKRGK